MDWKIFFRLWFQKILRNFASMKFWVLIMMYIPVVFGMFHFAPGATAPWISATIGLGFLGGGFVTLATSRIIARTKLTESSSDDEINCDK